MEITTTAHTSLKYIPSAQWGGSLSTITFHQEGRGNGERRSRVEKERKERKGRKWKKKGMEKTLGGGEESNQKSNKARPEKRGKKGRRKDMNRGNKQNRPPKA